MWFVCRHKKTSFPITLSARARRRAGPRTYIVCLDCGKEMPYSWDEMRFLRRRERHALKPEPQYQPVVPA
jgi:RNase P subunit RPR2